MGTRTVGELNVLDSRGQLQFLRRSLLAGAHKFEGSFDQIAPLAFFQEFKKRIASVTELDVIGYGFGDAHINEVLAEWLKTPDVILSIFDPHRKSIPPFLSGVAEKIRIRSSGLTDYLRGADSTKESLFARGRRQFLEDAREKLYQKRLAARPVSANAHP
jgi:hypothetical protein